MGLPLFIFSMLAGGAGAHKLTDGKSTDKAAGDATNWLSEKLSSFFNKSGSNPLGGLPLDGLRDFAKDNPNLALYGTTALASIAAYTAVSMSSGNGFLSRIGGLAAALAVGMFVHAAMKATLAENIAKPEAAPRPVPAPQPPVPT